MSRQAYRAGSFYEAAPDACRQAAQEILKQVELPKDLPEEIFGGIVPHAGWVFSGYTAAMTLKALSERNRLKRVVVFGADHWGIAGKGAVYAEGSWQTPLGEAPIDAELAQALLSACPLLREDARAHAREHSIEVQLPLMQLLNSDVKFVPINVSPSADAVKIGQAIGKVLKQDFPGVSVIGSTDLTHYGPQYNFTPGGTGPGGLDWARDNDRRVLKLIEGLRADQVVDETASRLNACGGGSTAAVIAAAAVMGAHRGLLLHYTTSAEVMADLDGMYRATASDSVGYASVIFA